MSKPKPTTARPARASTRPDLLARVAALGVRDRVVLVRAGLAPAFLSKARAGACGDPRASSSWEKLEAAVIELERENGAPGVAATATSSTASLSRGPSVNASPVAPAAAPVVLEGESAELDALIRAATSPTALSQLHLRIGTLAAAGIAKGGITPDVARVLIDVVKEQRQLIRSQREADEKARGSEPTTVRVVYENGWRQRTEAEGDASRSALVKAAAAGAGADGPHA